MPWDFFLIHDSADKALAEAIHDGLVARGRSAFLDSRSLRTGDVFAEVIPAAQRESAASVVLLTANLAAGRYAGAEIARALELRKGGVHRVLPLRFGVPPGTHYGLEATHAPDVGDAAGAVAELLGLPTPTDRKGPAPLLPARDWLDRTVAWADVVSRAGDESKHQLFLVHAAGGQSLDGFTRRIFQRVAKEAGPHGLFTVDVDSETYGRPTTPAKWRDRVAQALGGAGRPHERLAAAASREHVFLAFGSEPLTHAVQEEDEIRALATFLSDHLPALVQDASPARKIRLYLSVEEADVQDGWVKLLDTALASLAEQIGAGRARKGQRLTFPPWAEVQSYVAGLPVRATEAWYDRLEGEYERQSGGDFRAFCETLDRLLRKLERLG